MSTKVQAVFAFVDRMLFPSLEHPITNCAFFPCAFTGVWGESGRRCALSDWFYSAACMKWPVTVMAMLKCSVTYPSLNLQGTTETPKQCGAFVLRVTIKLLNYLAISWGKFAAIQWLSSSKQLQGSLWAGGCQRIVKWESVCYRHNNGK